MKTNRENKFSFEKFEIAKLKKIRIKGGGDSDPDTGTATNGSDDCSGRLGCKKPNTLDPNHPNNPFDPNAPDSDL